jgi:hypothetical protein
MSAAVATSAEPAPSSASADQPSRVGRLLDLVRRLIDYGKELAATFQRSDAATSLATDTRGFGTSDVALILARIASGLRRAEALEARVLGNARRLDAPRKPKPKTAPPRRAPRAAAAARPARQDPRLADLPTPEQIAAAVRRQPIGVVIADICRDLGITPSHPLWPELRLLITRHGGSLIGLFRDICQRLLPVHRRGAPAAEPAPPTPAPARSCTGPPWPLVSA